MSSPTSVERLPLGDEPPAAAVVERVRAALDGGGLVAIPTETVYGLAARADHARGLAALRALKGHDPDRALTWHVGDRAALERFPRLSPMAARLAERYWPGPLTLVLPGVPAGLETVAAEGWTGVRLPGQAGTAGLLAALDAPIVATSANRGGETPLNDAEAVSAAFGPELALVLDGGTARLGESSSVLAVGPGRFELLRAGLIDLGHLRATAGLRLGFCCTGNSCRSPMAEALARQLLGERLAVAPARLGEFGFELSSMGVAAGAGAPASAHAVEAIAELGGDLSAHSSNPARAEDLARFDRVYAMTAAHLAVLRSLVPPDRAGNLMLLSPEGEEVVDPIGGSLERYRGCRDQLRAMIERRLDEWA